MAEKPCAPCFRSSTSQLCGCSTAVDKPNNCAICLDPMEPTTGGDALFTAECSHTFHFQCIASNVQHGSHTCPLCLRTWKKLPRQAPQINPNPPRSHDRRRFDDDEPLDPQPQTVANDYDDKVDLKTFLEYPAIKYSTSLEDFSILVHLKAPSTMLSPVDSPRAAVDLVAVLDVSRSMSGRKLHNLKKAMAFVIQNLASHDRLSIVTFATNARRVFHLSRMMEDGKRNALQAIFALEADGCTNISQGLKIGVKVLEDRQQRNPVNSIIFLSDGKDTCSLSRAMSEYSQPSRYMSLLPSTILSGLMGDRVPVHAFGFGEDHDATLMSSISEASGGTFSFIETPELIQGAFAQCIGGLLSVVAQEVRVEVECLQPEIHINEITSGSYTSRLMDNKKKGVIEVRDLYAYEERDLLVSINVPSGEEAALLRVRCTYKDTVQSRRTISLEDEEVKVPRPKEVKEEECSVSARVERQKRRLQVVGSLELARAAADEGNLNMAILIVENSRRELRKKRRRHDVESLDCEVEKILEEIRVDLEEKLVEAPRVDSHNSNRTACLLSGKRSIGMQRACARSFNRSSQLVPHYRTPIMEEMVSRSQAQQAPRAHFGDSSGSTPSPPGEIQQLDD